MLLRFPELKEFMVPLSYDREYVIDELTSEQIQKDADVGGVER